MTTLIRLSVLSVVICAIPAQAHAWYPPPYQIDAGFNFWFNVNRLDQQFQAGPWYLYFPHEAHFQTPAPVPNGGYPHWPQQWPPRNGQNQYNNGQHNAPTGAAPHSHAVPQQQQQPPQLEAAPAGVTVPHNQPLQLRPAGAPSAQHMPHGRGQSYAGRYGMGYGQGYPPPHVPVGYSYRQAPSYWYGR